MRNESSIRYQKKLKAKTHSIKVSDVCEEKCDVDHPEHPESEEEEQGDEEPHPEIESFVN